MIESWKKIAILRKCRCCKQWHSIDDYGQHSKVCNACWSLLADIALKQTRPTPA